MRLQEYIDIAAPAAAARNITGSWRAARVPRRGLRDGGLRVRVDAPGAARLPGPASVAPTDQTEK